MLEKIKNPAELKRLSEEDISVLCSEIREKIVSCAAQSGGHLSSNLGMVEATVAFHRVFNCPEDTIVFDVGHQCYAHKLLTGRYESFETIRTLGGISGFTNRSESEYDALTAGHSGSALPCALGIARANALRGSDAWTVAVVGDGSFTNGMVYETLNSCHGEGLRLLIVLNDNEMSISKNVGSLSDYFTKLRNSRRYFAFKRHLQSFVGKIPLLGKSLIKICYNTKEFFKHMLMRINFFESMGLYYMGPVDGNDEKKMELLLREAMDKDKCTLIHMITVKGKGYKPAEKHPDKFHFAGNFDPVTGEFPMEEDSFSAAFGSHLCSVARENTDICAVTAAMDKGTGLSTFKSLYPDRFFDVGIAEECAATFAGGLAIGGKIPVLALYSTFMQRCYDQILEDIALQNVHCILAIDRAGYVSGDGVTHQGVFDVPLLSTVPGITLYAPETYNELRYCFDKCIAGEGLCAVRYPKGKEAQYDRSRFSDMGEIHVLEPEGDADCTVITYGKTCANAFHAAEELCGTHKIRIIKILKILPLDTDKILDLCKDSPVLVIEEGMRHGGIGEALAFQAAKYGMKNTFNVVAVDSFLTHAKAGELEKICKTDKDSIALEIKSIANRKN